MSPRIALYQPDIPGNTGTILRLASCLGIGVDIIEPAGFRIDDKSLKRAGMDYLERANLVRHADWQAFEKWRIARNSRLICLTTKADQSYTDFTFKINDVVLFGRESAGLPDDIHQRADARLIIPMVDHARSINLALSVAMVIGEVLRQTQLSGPNAGTN